MQCGGTSVECMAAWSFTCLEMTHLCDSVEFHWVQIHAFLAEYGATESDFKELYLTLFTIKYKANFACYLHEFEESSVIFFSLWL